MSKIPDLIANNPAGRLHRLIYGAQRTDNTDKKTVTQLWSEVLGIPTSDRPHLYSAICRIALLPKCVEEDMRRISDIDASRFTTWVSEATGALTVSNFDVKAQQVLGAFSPDRMSLILICDDMLRLQSETKAIAQTDVGKLKAQAQALRETILQADLDERFRSHILKHVGIIESALWDIPISGQAAAKAAVENTLGVAVADPVVFKNVAGTPVGKELLALLAAFVLVMDAGVHAGNLLEAGRDGISALARTLTLLPSQPATDTALETKLLPSTDHHRGAPADN